MTDFRELCARIETLEAAVQKHIVETSANVLALASRIEVLELAKRQSSKILDLSDLPQWTPEQVQNLQDLLGTCRNHVGLKEQAIEDLDLILGYLREQVDYGNLWCDAELTNIRRALEQLPE
jgi:hypothetical protein